MESLLSDPPTMENSNSLLLKTNGIELTENSYLTINNLFFPDSMFTIEIWFLGNLLNNPSNPELFYLEASKHRIVKKDIGGNRVAAVTHLVNTLFVSNTDIELDIAGFSETNWCLISFFNDKNL
jgi:hypothetical protein